MMYGKPMVPPAKKAAAKKAPAKGAFKPCKSCPNPAKCAKAGTCSQKATPYKVGGMVKGKC